MPKRVSRGKHSSLFVLQWLRKKVFFIDARCLFSLSLTKRQNKLECLSSASMTQNKNVFNVDSRWRTEKLANKTLAKDVETQIYLYARENLAIINIFIKVSRQAWRRDFVPRGSCSIDIFSMRGLTSLDVRKAWKLIIEVSF
jgi:hypothetical protein